MVKAMYFSRFLRSHSDGGGCRRMQQLHDMVKTILPQLELVTHLRGDRIPGNLRGEIIMASQQQDFWNTTPDSVYLQKWNEKHRVMVYRLQKFSETWATTIPELPLLDIAIMDDPIYFLPLFKKLRQHRVPIIALCQNIETLANLHVEKEWALELLQEELEIFSQCHLVITISREETVLLNNLGIPTLYIPYYPETAVRERLLAVRKNRLHNKKEGILMVGNTGNTQTLDGLVRAASYWQQHRLDQVVGQLIIGGYKSEMNFDSRPYGDTVDFRGTLSNQDMDDLLSRTKAFLCYQETGAGALTRIGEMLIAGVPVLANAHAARSYYNMKGVLEFQGMHQLQDVLHQLHTFDGEIPIPPAPDIFYLDSKLKKIIAER